MSDQQRWTCPDPLDDPEGYGLWCEMAACTACDGLGEDDQCEDGGLWTCPRCEGSGIDPGFEVEPFDGEE